MKSNENTIKGRWLEIRGDLQKAWGKLTDDDLEKTKGDIKSIAGLIQQRYSNAQDIYSKKLSDIFYNFDGRKQTALEKVKQNLKQNKINKKTNGVKNGQHHKRNIK